MAAATPLSRALTKEITKLGRATVLRIVRLAPETAGAYFRLIQRSGNDPDVVAAVKAYVLAARRAEKYADDATKKLFAGADEVLTARLKRATDPDSQLLGRELAHRRLAVLGTPEGAPAKLDRAAARAVKAAAGPDVYAATLQRGFFDRLRSIAALGEPNWTAAQRLLMTGRRKLLSTLGGQWADAWEPTFAYLRDNAINIAPRIRAVRSAEAALDAARTSGSATAIRAAERAVETARQRVDGYLSPVKGRLGEAYVPRWDAWKIQMEGFLEVAQREARASGRGWEAQRVVGGLRLDGAEAWDEAILLVNRRTGHAKLFLAAQYKVEKQVSALTQIENDILRETTSAAGRLPRVTFDGEAFELTPMPVGKPSHRFVFNAAGGRFSSRDIDRLRAAGIEVNQLNLDISVAEFDQVARTLIDVVSEIVP
jgi:hypothetical protein